MKLKLFFFFCLTTSILFAQETHQIIRYPALSPDGSQIAFSYQGDIWTVPSSGGKAIRLTIHEAYESQPQWSPDGKKLLFSSGRNGNSDIYTIGTDGNNLKRITFHSAGDSEGNWNGNDEIFFSTRRNYIQVEREFEFHKINSNGGTPERALNVLGSDLNINPTNNLHAFVKGGCRIEREAYRGPAQRDIWIYNPSNKQYFQLTDDEGQDVRPEWGKNNELYFLSARNGRYNIYKTTLEGNGDDNTEFEALTNFQDEGIRNFDVAANGNSLVFMHGEKLHLHNLISSETKVVDLILADDYRFDPIKHESISAGISDYALSPDEKNVAFIANGDLFFKRNDKEKPRSINPLSQSSRETDVEWLNDSIAYFLSDRNGTYDLFRIYSSDANENSIFKSFKWQIDPVYTKAEEIVDFSIAPDRDKIAILIEPGHLVTMDIDSNGVLSNETTLLDDWASPGGLNWSPDGEWLAYSLEDLNFNEEIFIHKADNSIAPVNVSMHPRGDYSPIWSRDGSKLGFLSIRNNGDADVWFAWLSKKDYEKTRTDWEELDDDQPEKKNTENENGDDKKDKELIHIDLEGIHERLVQVSRLPGNEGDLAIDGEGELFMFSTNNGSRAGSEGKSSYKKVKWNGEDLTDLIPDASGILQVQLDKSGKSLYFRKRGKISKVTIDGAKVTAYPHSAKMDVHVHETRQQVFDEAWRTINDRFYDPKFHGRDWVALRSKYEDRALAASTQQDFQMLVNEMLGQINASHMGLYGSGPEETQRESTGLLGVELENHSEGVKITSIVEDSPADKEESKLYPGELITSVNNIQIEQGINFYSLLNGKVNEQILLEVKSLADTSREVIIRPKSSLSSEKYEQWINERKALTEKYSNGRLGYIHIRGMNWPSFERFERELMASGYGKEGVVIDVRFNGGGWTTDMVMAVLNVRQHAYTIPRGATDDLEKNHTKFKENYPYGERLPLSALTKPSIALCNERSYSNAEIFSHAFKTLGHGKLVGKPTFGAVISTGGRGLMDGSFVRVPFRAWYVKATEENMEWGPAVPDYIVDNSFEAKAENTDQQLEKAVEVLLEQIDN